MKKTKFLFVILQFIFLVAICNAQYIIKPAFPDLPNLIRLVELVNADDGTNRLFAVQISGVVSVFENTPTVNSKKVFIDLSSKITYQGTWGLLGLAFHPDYENNRYFYANFSFDSASVKWLRVSRFTTSPTNPDSAMISEELILTTTPMITGGNDPHSGGKITFGPDGYLYISIGEGTLPNGVQSPAQDRTVLPGKILRINVDSASGGRNYSIPQSNPYFENTEGYREEIYAYGFRNMWKFSIDYPTNRIWGGDVGAYSYEEIDIIENGKNYGWDRMEGFHCYGVCDTVGMGFAPPIFEYPNLGGAAVMGGYVYRGSLNPELYGKYIYVDNPQGVMGALDYDGVNPPVYTEVLDTSAGLVTFGVDENNELYVCTFSTGRIFKIVNLDMITLDLKTSIEGFFDSPYNSLNMSDTIDVYLRSINSPYSIIDSSKAVIDSSSFSGLSFFNNTPNGRYYIALKHRNALETWSKSGGDSLINGIVNNFDFTSANTMAYGNNLVLKGGKYCIYSGDVNQDGNINVADVLLISNDAADNVTGYVNTDVNGDNVTDLTDILITYNNAINFVATITP